MMAAILAHAVVAHALTQREVACQAAIARAGKAYVVAELANRGRCRAAAIRGRACDPSDRTDANGTKLRHALRRCTDVTLSHLSGGGCAGSSATLDALGTCLLDGHDQAVETLLTAEFGLDISE